MVALIRATFAVALLLTLTSVAAKEGGTLAPSADFTSLSVEFQDSIDGEEAAEMRGAMDTSGDGQISQDEVDDFAAQMEDFVGFLAETALMDGEPAEDYEVNSLTLDGAMGDADSDAAMTLMLDADFEYTPGSGTTHTLVLESSGEGSDATLTTIKAPAGYVIQSHDGGRDPSLSGDKRTLTLNDQDDEDITVVFAKAAAAASDDDKDSPGAGPLMAISLLAVAVVARRRL